MKPVNKPFGFKCIYYTVSALFPKTNYDGLENLPEEPCVIVGNHSQMNGPIMSEVRFPFKHYTWCIGQMMDRKEVADYSFRDFWSGKPKYIRWFFWLFSRIIPLFAPYVFNNADTVPVYHDSRVLTTFRRSVEVMKDGNSLVIFPEKAVPKNNILCEFQDGFVDLARLYCRRTGKTLNFVPLYIAPKLKTAYFCKPVVFDPSAPIEEERVRISDAISDAITEKARSLPEHTVVPYLNVSKRRYLKNTDIEAKIS